MREQLGLLGSLTGSHPTPSKRGDARRQDGRRGEEGASQEQLADVVALPRREDGSPARRRSDR